MKETGGAGSRGRRRPAEKVNQLDAALIQLVQFFRQPTGIARILIESGTTEQARSAFRVLRAVRDGAVSVVDIQAALGVTHSTASRLADNCVTWGFVTRTTAEDDRRKVVLALTTAGRAAIAKVEGGRRAFVAEVTRDWSDADVEALTELVARFATQAKDRTAGEIVG